MSLRPEPLPSVPATTAAAVRAAFPKGNLSVDLRTEFGTLYHDQLFADLYPPEGRPVEVAPWRLALVMVMQYIEGLTDRQAADAGEYDLTDDAAVVERAGHAVYVFEGDKENVKLTTADDFARAEARLLGNLADVRCGQGFDVHAFGPGDHVWLGAMKIPHDHGLEGHSDADVLAHAITDAILGALADGDIGAHFPPSDPKWKGAASSLFLADAVGRVKARGGLIAHVDGTIICERPKIGPYRDAIRESLARIMNIAPSRMALKATTSERLGFTGRGEGIAALATATVRLPYSES